MTRSAATGASASARVGVRADAGRRSEQSRARYPEESGYVSRAGVELFWERYGTDGPPVVLLPTWSVIHSRFWKLQIPFLARSCRVATFDGRGNGRSDRPVGAEAYATQEFAADTLAVMDACGFERAALVSLSCGALWATIVAAEHPERVDRIAYISPAAPLAPSFPEREQYGLDEVLDTDEGWAKYNTHYWQRDYAAFLQFFAAKCINEEHSTKPIEDFVGWGLETTPDALADATRGLGLGGRERWRAQVGRVRCPTLVIHGDADVVRPLAQGRALAAATGGELVVLEGAGHLPNARDPVRVNLLLRSFLLGRGGPPARWRRAPARTRRALYLSSPIGLGHARRDLAIADALRARCPGLEIDWLAQHPVTAVLERRGERIHPASAALAGESAHIVSESSGEDGHDLHCFQAIRRMDEILLSNFMVFLDAVRETPYDLWIGDEAWELDYFLHENPELKTAAYAWLTDFVGWLPMPDGGTAEAAVTRDLNAEMIEQVARYPRVRDRAIFVGEPADIVPGTFGDGLPEIRDWTEGHYRFSGYITGSAPLSVDARTSVRRELGYGDDEQVCVVTVGGSGVGAGLLQRAIDSFPAARRLVPGLRMVVVAGPRAQVPGAAPGGMSGDGLEVRGYVPDLDRHLAACDLAIIQGGLATAMELAASRRPFLYFPLAHHFEQNLHVRYRLERYGAGRALIFSETPPGALAQAIADEIGRDTDPLPVRTDGAARAAEWIAELL